ncbi:hypothetical protein BCR44DRAFT_1015375 [Catenaria anguillulae PL171]|uniref:Uncharacterized protein n=1 Tax=Catenaria anguillulae PL171 TaxID=765915 RepID=A0A1Y2HWD0_9FUNG|nr:hypothetical protein BCR44DRAFT_1015375 [Catenaria anguillulae PL171]
MQSKLNHVMMATTRSETADSNPSPPPPPPVAAQPSHPIQPLRPSLDSTASAASAPPHLPSSSSPAAPADASAASSARSSMDHSDAASFHDAPSSPAAASATSTGTGTATPTAGGPNRRVQFIPSAPPSFLALNPSASSQSLKTAASINKKLRRQAAGVRQVNPEFALVLSADEESGVGSTTDDDVDDDESDADDLDSELDDEDDEDDDDSEIADEDVEYQLGLLADSLMQQMHALSDEYPATTTDEEASDDDDDDEEEEEDDDDDDDTDAEELTDDSDLDQLTEYEEDEDEDPLDDVELPPNVTPAVIHPPVRTHSPVPVHLSNSIPPSPLSEATSDAAPLSPSFTADTLPGRLSSLDLIDHVASTPPRAVATGVRPASTMSLPTTLPTSVSAPTTLSVIPESDTPVPLPTNVPMRKPHQSRLRSTHCVHRSDNLQDPSCRSTSRWRSGHQQPQRQQPN